jgi:RNA polymerase sigma-70 factor (ECF subfamily)
LSQPDPYLWAADAGYIGFEAWYSENHRRVLHVVTVVSGDPEAARESTDEAFARALARWNRVGAMTSPTGWTCKVAINHLRRGRWRRQRESELLSSPAGDTWEQENFTVWAEVLEAVRPLTVRQRTVLALLYIADLSQEEVAKVLRVTRSTVASTLADARSAVMAGDRRSIGSDGLGVTP